MPFGIELEVLDDGFHRTFHFTPSRRNDLVVAGGNEPLSVGLAKLFNALFHDAHRLTHLFHAHEVAIVAVAMLTDRDVEIKLGVAFIGLRLAQVPCRSGAAHHHAGKSPSPCIGELDHANPDVALFKNAIAREQPIQIVHHTQKGIAKGLNVVNQLWRQILMHAADTKIIGVHACTGSALVEHHEFFALFEAP